jgi:hypothetical protein
MHEGNRYSRIFTEIGHLCGVVPYCTEYSVLYGVPYQRLFARRGNAL